LHWRGDAFTPEQKARDFAYYEALTVRDSSLSASTQAVVAAEVGHLELAYDYLGEAALMDLHDLAKNTADGLHMASLAGAWLAVAAGFGGMRDHGGKLTFAPRLPGRLQRLAFGLVFRDTRLRIEVTKSDATYSILGGPPLEVAHHGEAVTVSAAEPVTRAIPPLQDPGAAPAQPRGRAPQRRGVDGA
jgi:alpha,alpha-trehalose phosphorylase